MKGNIHLVNLEDSHYVVHRYETYIYFLAKKNGSIFTIFNQVSSKSGFVIYPLECKKCQMQYVGKAETDFN